MNFCEHSLNNKIRLPNRLSRGESILSSMLVSKQFTSFTFDLVAVVLFFMLFCVGSFYFGYFALLWQSLSQSACRNHLKIGLNLLLWQEKCDSIGKSNQKMINISQIQQTPGKCDSVPSINEWIRVFFMRHRFEMMLGWQINANQKRKHTRTHSHQNYIMDGKKVAS